MQHSQAARLGILVALGGFVGWGLLPGCHPGGAGVRIDIDPTMVPTTIVAPFVGRVAPDDNRDPTTHHIYVVKKAGVASTFVWVPVFTAFQLIDPPDAGCSTCSVGAWVKSEPSAGVENIDWATEKFGGFYVAKYEASHVDAMPGNPQDGAGAKAGVIGAMKVEHLCPPWVDVTWDEANGASAAYLPPYSHLMRDDEWAALAVWSMIHGVRVYGNNDHSDWNASYPKPPSDTDDPTVTFLNDPSLTWSEGTPRPNDNIRSLTGSGTSARWRAGINLTTHTGTTIGAYDVNGNVVEWTANVGTAKETGNYVLYDGATGKFTDTGITVGPNSGDVASASISALATDPRLRRFGLPGGTGQPAQELGPDGLWKNSANNTRGQRGGDFLRGRSSGIWSVHVVSPGSVKTPGLGFRPALVYP